jgi:hypothetical protein
MAMTNTSGISLQAVQARLAALEATIATKDAKIAELEAKNARGPTPVRCKVSEKGCVMVLGGRIRKFGMTYYASEWQNVLDNADMIRKFIEDNKALLSFKDKDTV